MIQWSGVPEEQATWEEMYTLKQQFPYAPAWGQAGFQDRGIVNDRVPPASDSPEAQEEEGTSPGSRWPTRQTKPPAWLTDSNWVT